MYAALPDRVRIGAIEVDLRAGELREGERKVCLQEQPLFVLRMLLARPGEVVTREEIKQKLWPNDTVVDFDQGVNAAIRKLRIAFGDSADEPKYLGTIARRGYRLLLPVHSIGPPENREEVGTAAGNGTAVRQQKEPGLIGKKVSHYRVLKVIGGGGMGLVYEAEDLKLGRRVALKFLPDELAWDPTALQRFEREARATSSLDHPNICTIHEVEEHEAQPFIVMQLLEGETLGQRLSALSAANTRMGVHELLEIAIQICQGLQAAHDKGIIHRDIKPPNIFLTVIGQVKILDFGLAKLVHAAKEAGSDGMRLSSGGAVAGSATSNDITLTIVGAAMGTAGYMSPEQIRGEKLDSRADIFSFGCVLYEMATGKRAFQADTAIAVQDAIVKQNPVPMCEFNAELPTGLQEIVDHAIEKNRDRRYQTAAEVRWALEDLQERTNPTDEPSERGRRWGGWLAAAVVSVAMVAAGLYWRLHQRPKLSDQDTIVICDFENRTGDPVFDDTLKQALSAQLSQSPFLNLLPTRKLRSALKGLNRSTSEPLTEDLALEVCRHTGSKAVVAGSIGEFGKNYMLELKTRDCNAGDILAEAQEQAEGKQAVLKALDEAAISVRKQMGEPLSSVRKYAAPLAEPSASSLEAWKAYSMGVKIKHQQGGTHALTFFKRAVELDPAFAKAYINIAGVYQNLNKSEIAEAYFRKAYELRDKVSERERFSIEASYYEDVTGELDEAARVYELWARNYPRDVTPKGDLGIVYDRLGYADKDLELAREAMRLEPNDGIAYINLASAYLSLNRLDEVEQVYTQAEQRNAVFGNLRRSRYFLAFLKEDPKLLAQAVAAWNNPAAKDLLQATQADTEGWYGKFDNARVLVQQAIDQEMREDAKEDAAAHMAAAALREVAAGNRGQARAQALAASQMAQNSDVLAMAALALAQAGDIPSAEALASQLDKSHPLDTLVQRYWLPTIRAAVALERNDPNRAVDLLKGMGSLELGNAASVTVVLCPVYVRGEAYLKLADGQAAAAEFQKFIEHYGFVANFPWGALARLGLARAYALEAANDPGAREKARTAYQNFLILWKDADPGIPIYKQAKAEYARLQ